MFKIHGLDDVAGLIEEQRPDTAAPCGTGGQWHPRSGQRPVAANRPADLRVVSGYQLS
jgi:hypothetical protein